MPNMIIIAGPNGAGKTTAAPALLQDVLQVDDFINADVIAQGLCGFQPEKEAIRAGRIMLNRINSLAKEKINFAFETTLASRTFINWIPTFKEQGYQIFCARPYRIIEIRESKQYYRITNDPHRRAPR